ncbi:MAG TPA: phytanoyl-CoA dioxygenase family protein [Actinopolymorphaceae bacterium]|jgi:ectoine hydroxylase-related dioxygenase (phytanoyl-CoA dioxygenase family)
MTDQTQLKAYVDAYEESGYVLVKGLLSKSEAAEYREECHALVERLNRDVDPTWGSARELTMGQQTMLRHCHDVQFYSAAFSKLIIDPRFTDIAAALMKTPNVQLHHTKMFVKPPEKGSPFPMHQDYPYFPHAKHSVAAAIFHFDDAPLAKGCVRVVPGSHKNGPIEHESEGGFHLPFEKWPLESSVPCEAEAGDVLFFSYLTVHGSGINTTSEPRTTVLVQFRDPTDPPTVDRHTQSLGQGMMLRGIDPTSRSASA